jgi:hypothetical protein
VANLRDSDEQTGSMRNLIQHQPRSVIDSALM